MCHVTVVTHLFIFQNKKKKKIKEIKKEIKSRKIDEKKI